MEVLGKVQSKSHATLQWKAVASWLSRLRILLHT